jgi:hypothetical protein
VPVHIAALGWVNLTGIETNCATFMAVGSEGSETVGVNSWFQKADYGAMIILAVAKTIDRSRISIIK